MNAPSRPYASDVWYRVADVRCALRAGLRVVPIRFRQRLWYAVHEPASGRVHRLSGPAWAWLSSLSPDSTVDEHWRRQVELDPDRAPGQSEIVELLADLHAADLLQSDRPSEMAALIDRRQRQRKPLWLQNLLNPLSIRIPLWDPDRFLAALHGWLRPAMGLPAWLAWAALVLPAAVLAAMHGRELTANLADHLLAPSQWLLLLPLLFLAKLVHELAHGVMIRHGGGATHEMGVMLLVFMPVPYVEATATNAMPSRWSRAAVGVAGMWIELAICAVAVHAWVLLEPGLARSAAHQLILATGISTLLFNANPLLRFDGYYVLGDVVEIPNLASRSNALWLALLRRHGLGDDRHALPPAPLGERGWLLAYAPLALAYRLVLMLSIALFVMQAYPVFGAVMAVVAVALSLGWPMLKAAAFVVGDPALGRRRPRALLGVVLGMASLWVLLFVLPAPRWLLAEGLLWVPPEAELRAPEDAVVTRVMAPHAQALPAGQAVLQLASPELHAECAAQQARVVELEVRLQDERDRDRLRAALTAAELRREQATLRQLQDRLDALQMRAGTPGRLLLSRAADLPGRPVARGDLLGLVDAPQASRVRVVVGQDDVGLVRSALRGVEVILVDAPGQALPARLQRAVTGGESRLPSRMLSLNGGGTWATDPTDADDLRTLQRVFDLELVLPLRPAGSALGTRAWVKFSLEPEALGLQGWRRLRQLFLARLDL